MSGRTPRDFIEAAKKGFWLAFKPGWMRSRCGSASVETRVFSRQSPPAKGRSMRAISFWTISGMCVALVVACSSEDPAPAAAPCGNAGAGSHPDNGQAASCANYLQRLLDCEVITGSRLAGCADDDPILACAWDCMQKASCAQIKTSYCDDAFNSYAGCLNECNSLPPPFTCDDGSQIDARWQCDGVADCPNGEDENCVQGTFTCDSGATIPAAWQWDQVLDCTGGEDERDCPGAPMIACDTGESIPASSECNGVADCPQGEDELECAMLTCDLVP